MLFLPRHRVTVSAMHSDWIFVPLSIMYAALLLQSWTPDTLKLIMPGSLQAGLAGCCPLSTAGATTGIALDMLLLFTVHLLSAVLLLLLLISGSNAGKFSPQFFPKLVGIQLLFSKTVTAASLWVHLLSINLFTARTAYVQGASCSSTATCSICVEQRRSHHACLQCKAVL